MSFNVSDLQQNWIYTAQSGDVVNFVAAASGGGVTINDNQQGTIQLNSSGSPSTPVSALQEAMPFGLGQTTDQEPTLATWLQNSNGQPLALAGPILSPPLSPYPEASGGPQNQRGSVPTASITVRFRGDLSPGDHLVFPTATSQACTQTLGLWYCPLKSWVYNVEIAATVSDDASKWNARQSANGSGSGYWRDSGNSLHSFQYSQNVPVDDPCNWPNDTRPKCYQINVLQQTKGQKAIFWIDAPGLLYYYDAPNDTEPIDSVNQVQHFISTVCNRFDVCTNVKWFFNLVVDPGSKLDGVRSDAGLGPGSNP